MSNSNKNPWWWVPTLYFAEGIPYFIVNVISVTMFKRLGMPNGDLAMYTSLLYLPWVIKPLWSPFVDVIRTKRWWILLMQALCTLGFAALALSVSPDVFGWSLVIFYIIAFASATHDIAADGFYMIALDPTRQSVFVGIRSTFYRIASVFGQGVIVVLAGVLEERLGVIPRAWSITLLASALLFALITFWHWKFLPKVEAEKVSVPERQGLSGTESEAKRIFRDFGQAWVSFFKKPGVWLAIVFMLLYRLPEAFSVKMLTPFLLDPPDAGGLGLSTAQSGLVYGTVGVIALTVGGILGGLFAAKLGLRRSMWPMSMALALPCAVYLLLALMQPSALWSIYLLVALDQFGYGFGFTAYMLYMMQFSEGEFKTSHYAICTAFMALSMMIPGLFAGWMQEALGYVGFFIVVMICCLATITVTFFARRRCSS
ncbi:MAG: AmpG family muropeptide MFS transporter [Bacteroidales bacterium]|jgi:PAT family beta-lactamase induction signal transducer AmpG|nr:AmpG family muropeptide MFS transporter [Bacteroidales bacterium]